LAGFLSAALGFGCIAADHGYNNFNFYHQKKTILTK